MTMAGIGEADVGQALAAGSKARIVKGQADARARTDG